MFSRCFVWVKQTSNQTWISAVSSVSVWENWVICSIWIDFVSFLFRVNCTQLHRWISLFFLVIISINPRWKRKIFLDSKIQFPFLFTFPRSRAKKSRLQEARASWDAQGRQVLGDTGQPQPRELILEDVCVYDILFDWTKLIFISTILMTLSFGWHYCRCLLQFMFSVEINK